MIAVVIPFPVRPRSEPPLSGLDFESTTDFLLTILESRGEPASLEALTKAAREVLATRTDESELTRARVFLNVVTKEYPKHG